MGRQAKRYAACEAAIARTAFRPLCAISQEPLIPHSDADELVEGVPAIVGTPARGAGAIVMNTGFVVLSRDPLVRGEVVNAGAAAGQLYLMARDAEELVTTIAASRPRAVIIDREYGEADDVLRRLTEHEPSRPADTMLFQVIRDTSQEPVPGADVIVVEPALRHALALTGHTLAERRPLALDRLLTISVLSGALDDALEAAAAQLAVGFGVDRCVISVRGDTASGTAVGSDTWDSLTWNRSQDYCRIATSTGASVIAPSPAKGGAYESYLAVPLETALGSHGFVGLIIARPRIFSREHRTVLQAIASRPRAPPRPRR